jgi:hypothetical protein
MVVEDGQLHTLGLLEQLRDQCKSLWGTSSELYFRVDKLLNQLANPNLHDIPSNLQIRVELWDRYDKHIRWVIAATSSIVIGNAAYDVAVSVHPQERVLLRQGIRVIREHVPKNTRPAALSAQHYCDREPRRTSIVRLASARISSLRLFSRLEGLSANARFECGGKMVALQPFPTELTSIRNPLYSTVVIILLVTVFACRSQKSLNCVGDSSVYLTASASG